MAPSFTDRYIGTKVGTFHPLRMKHSFIFPDLWEDLATVTSLVLCVWADYNTKCTQHVPLSIAVSLKWLQMIRLQYKKKVWVLDLEEGKAWTVPQGKSPLRPPSRVRSREP